MSATSCPATWRSVQWSDEWVQQRAWWYVESACEAQDGCESWLASRALVTPDLGFVHASPVGEIVPGDAAFPAECAEVSSERDDLRVLIVHGSDGVAGARPAFQKRGKG